MKGLFITIEGPDGSGKTTVTTILKERLEKLGYDIVHTREPGGIEIAEQIRNIILDVNNTAMDGKTEALLYAASRRQHLVEKVYPAIKEGKIVLCERFIDSSLAYQGYGRNLGFEEILNLNLFATDKTFPDLTIYLDVDEQVGLDRINANRTNKDRLDQESIDFHHRVVQGYKRVLDEFKDRIVVVDASKQLDDVVEECMKIILGLING